MYELSCELVSLLVTVDEVMASDANLCATVRSRQSFRKSLSSSGVSLPISSSACSRVGSAIIWSSFDDEEPDETSIDAAAASAQSL